MTFRATFCDPFKTNIQEMGEIEKDNIISLFEQTPWEEYLERMETEKEAIIHYSPTLEIENKENLNGLCISAIDGIKWDLFYKRPKLKKMFFGLYQKMDNNYLTDTCVHNKSDVIACLMALIDNDLNYLENRIKEQTILAPFVPNK